MRSRRRESTVNKDPEKCTFPDGVNWCEKASQKAGFGFLDISAKYDTLLDSGEL
jgi:hypothetical protein